MIISKFNIDTASAHTLTSKHEVKESLRVWVDQPQNLENRRSTADNVSISQGARQKFDSSSQANSINDAADSAENDPRILILKFLIERLTGVKVRSIHIELNSETAFDPSAFSHQTPMHRHVLALAQNTIIMKVTKKTSN